MLVVMLLWEKFRPGKLRLVPGALLGIAAATTAAQIFHLRRRVARVLSRRPLFLLFISSVRTNGQHFFRCAADARKIFRGRLSPLIELGTLRQS
jgi:MFS superfamily sulfate permease-like transporter